MNEKIPLLLDETDAATVRRILPKVKVGDVPEGYAANITAAQLLTLIKRADAPFARDLKEVAAMHGIVTEKKRAKKPKQTRLQKMGAAMKKSGFKGTGGYGDNPRDRLYYLVAVNNKTGKVSEPLSEPDTHERTMTMKGKFTAHPARRIEIREAPRATNPVHAPGKWPTTITRFMDDEIYYAKTGKYAPSYLKQNRAPELARFLAKSPAYARAYEEVLKDAWNGRATNPARAPIELHIDAGNYEKNPANWTPRSGPLKTILCYRITPHGAWKRTSVSAKSVEAISRDALGYIEMFARENQVSPQRIALLIVDEAGNELWQHKSDQEVNGERAVTTLPYPKAKRAKNPATVHNKSRGAASMILKLTGHPKGAGYWTGTEWDTTKAKARRFDTMAGAVAVGKKLATDLPASYRIEVHAAGK